MSKNMRMPAVVSVLLIGFAASSSSANVEEVLEEVCQSHARRGAPGFNVAVSVRHEGKEHRFKKTCGLANLETARGLSSETPFYLASLTKQFTAFAILLLERDGKLSLDAPVKRYLPDASWGGDVRVGHLLHHTSGMREHWTVWRLSAFRGDTMEGIARLLAAQRGLDFVPGERFRYTNANYVLLARIGERVSGKTLPEFLRARVFGPLKMNDTAFGNESAFDDSIAARGYVATDDGFERFVFKASDIVGDGGLYSSIDDLLTWSREFYVESLGPLTAARIATTPFADGSPSRYGAGMRRGFWRGLVSWEHGGGFGGASTYLGTFPDYGISIVVLANVGDIDASAIYATVRDKLLGPRPDEAEEPRGPATCTPPDASGWFGLLGERPYVVQTRRDDAALVFTSAGRPDRRYFCRPGGAWVRDDAPQVTMRFYPGGPLTLAMNDDPVGLMQPMAPRAADRRAEAFPLGDYTAADVGGGIWRFAPGHKQGEQARVLNVTTPRRDKAVLARIAPGLYHAPGLDVIVEVSGDGDALRLYTSGAWGIRLERVESD